MSSINLDAIRNRLTSLKNSTNRSSNIWKPEPGEHQIRIVPYAFNLENPFIELFFHYNLAKRSILSPTSFGRPDPVVEFSEKLKQAGDKESWIMGRKIEPKMRTFVPILVRGQEKDGVKFWGFGKQVYEELLSFIADPDYGDITSLTDGRDVVMTVKTAEETGKSFAETSIRIKPKETAASTDPVIIEKIKVQPAITDLFPEPTYEELETVLKTWLGASETESTDSEVTRGNTPTSTMSKSEVETTFDNLFK